MVEITKEPINISEAVNSVSTDESGAVNVFIGTVRNQTKNKQVLRLEFEAYEKMAISEMQKIEDQVRKKWPVKDIVIIHRTGTLQPGEVPVVIAVATPHRKASFEACQYAIDTLKETVPIWKKEVFEDGETWVAAHP